MRDLNFMKASSPPSPRFRRDRFRGDGSYSTNGHGGLSLKDIPVADRSRSENPVAEKRAGLGQTNVFNPSFMRRTARDAVPPRQVVTAYFLGDPRPGRSAQDMRDEAARRVSP
jgi:hypothetical protein